MRVAINALLLNKSAGGLGIYLEHLVNYMLSQETPFEPYIYVTRDWYESNSRYHGQSIIQPVAIKAQNPYLRILQEPLFWKQRLKNDKIDLFYSPISYIPFGVSIPSVMTIHDLRSFHEKQYYTFLRYHYLKWMIGRSARRARHIIAVSQFTANDIVSQLGIDKQKISVAHEGIAAHEYNRQYSSEQLKAIKRQYGIHDHFILSIGHLEPRKNFYRLIQAYASLRREKDIKHQLVIVGKENWLYQDVYDLVETFGLQEWILFTKFVHQDHISALYQMAEIFVTLSTFEGFGFTPLESMAAGTPVIASNCTSLPEVTGDAALLCDPYSLKEISNSIWELLDDKKLQQSLVLKGYENIKRFDWNTGLTSVCEIIKTLHEREIK